jgi:hypothetical protein
MKIGFCFSSGIAVCLGGLLCSLVVGLGSSVVSACKKKVSN